jgi:hypothetical protein
MNQFNEICVLASKENWCWRILCTTCGHAYFRHALLELTQGKSPRDTDWITNNQGDNSFICRHAPRNFNNRQRNNIALICRGADLKFIADNCKFPDWLGYLGLIVHHFTKPQRRPGANRFINESTSQDDFYVRLSRDWAMQLQELVYQGSPIYERLNELIKNGDTLTLKDIQDCENCI